jgi:hypothetical protein
MSVNALTSSGVAWHTDAAHKERFRMSRIALATICFSLFALGLGVAQAHEPAGKPAQGQGAGPAVTPPPGAPAPTAPPAVTPPPGRPEICYELSTDGKSYSRTPQFLCVIETGSEITASLRVGIPLVEVLTGKFTLSGRVRCLDCRKDILTLAVPTGTILPSFAIVFDGKRPPEKGTGQLGPEQGTVKIAGKKYFYRERR